MTFLKNFKFWLNLGLEKMMQNITFYKMNKLSVIVKK